MNREKILFIVNPISGGKSKLYFPSLIDKYLDHSLFEAFITFSEYGGHACELAEDAISNGYDCVVAVGGDGTINEVASKMMNTGKKMGIIPCGSGNGLARTLRIPLNNAKAIKLLNRNRTRDIDSGSFGHKFFFNMAGLGFDARISTLFAENHKRGFKGYAKSVLQEIRDYKEQSYNIVIDGIAYQRKAFMLSIANSSQYGNNAHISPKAKVDDGLLDVCIIKSFPLYLFPGLFLKMISKTVDRSKYVEIIQGKHIKITRNNEEPAHVDGEPIFVSREININVQHLSLKIMV
ncbi:diacylglycerol/lipid kinase family protein [Pseudopedobacter beijingensis]|uniref:Diacylglycerol/lipid kinase family protein n=1 Tax=Pseudopedobacter beijingensis TaxID=1207056 RepID=A0ABW4I8U7_9SPHI